MIKSFSFPVWRLRAWLFLATVAAVLLTSTVGCSQSSVDQVNITPRNPISGNTSFISNIDLQGASIINPSSAGHRLSIHAVGRNAVRTSSSSATFRMTSGIGVD